VGGIPQEYADLTVFDASGGARVLAFDPTGLVAFLEETALVYHEDGLLGAEGFQDVSA